MILRWAARHGKTISAWFMDVEGRNPRDMAFKRREFQRMIGQVQEGLWDWIAVDSQDRFGTANRNELGYYLHILTINDCELWSVDASQGKEGLLTSDDDATAFTTTVGSVTSRAALLEYGKRQVSGKRERAARAEWQGGYVPYGFDVSCLDNRTDNEVWRVVVKKMIPRKRIWERIVVFPDCRQERCDGENIFPRRQDWERLELAPSIIAERNEIVQGVFRLFASGAWTVRGLCQRLNQLHIDPVIGEGWYHTRLLPLLKNPVYYLGATVWGKKSHGKNAWYVGGEYLIPPKKRGKATTGRKNKVEDWVFPPAGTAIITKELFDEVQARLDGRPEFKRGLRDERLWLAQMVICDRCGLKMSGWSQGGLSYYCTTYGKYGKANPTGCRLHKISQDVILSHVDRYLEEMGLDTKALVSIENKPALLGELVRRVDRQDECFMEVERQMRAYLKERGVAVGDWEGASLPVLYRKYFDHERADLERQLADATAELRNLILNLSRIDPNRTQAIQIQNDLIAGLDQQVRELKDRLVPLDDKLEAAFWAVNVLDSAIQEAREAMSGDDARRKALALRKVVAEIRLSFRHYEHRCHDRRAKTASQPRSAIQTIEFVPVQGEPICYEVGPHTLTAGNQPGPG
jgi:hypothetical protein